MDRRWVVGAAVVAVAVASGMWFGSGVEQPATPVTVPGSLEVDPVATSSPEAALVRVHVAGWVEHPGLVDLAPGARVADAIAAAGGVRPGGALESVNLAQPVTDGSQVVVPGPGEGAPPAPPGQGQPAAGGPVQINSANQVELETLPGVGPVLAGRIIAHRQQHGPFQAVEDLLDVAGIGEVRLAALRDLVAVP